MNDSPPIPDDGPQWPEPLVEFWRRHLAEVDATAAPLLQELPRQDAPPEARREWLSAASACSDRFLRSPEFLKAMRQNLAALVQAASTDSSGLAQQTAPDRATLGRATAPSALADIDRWAAAHQALIRQSWEHSQKTSGARGVGLPLAGGATPADVVHSQGTLTLRRYRRAEPSRYAEPVVFCCSLVNRPTIVDLQPRRSVVRHLLDRGFDVFLIDWGVPSAGDRELGLEHYVENLIHEAAAAARRCSAAHQISLVGYCMGGTLATMFTALHPQQVKNLVLLAAPIDFSDESSLLTLWARSDHFDVDALVAAFGNCPGALLQSCFQLMRPVHNFAEKYLLLCQRRDDQAFLENFFAMEQWANDSVPVAGEAFRQFVKRLYQGNQLALGSLELGGRGVDLRNVVCPILLLTAQLDHLVPQSASLAIRGLVASRDVESLSLAAGHIGLAVSTKAHAQLWPRAADWLAQRSTPKP